MLPACAAPEAAYVAQLSHLASQHHASDYSTIKHGPKGAPVQYVPISLALPEHVLFLRARQAHNARVQPWTRSILPRTDACPHTPPDPASLALHHELLAAIDEPLDLVTPLGSPMLDSQIKTSYTHPINVSSLISTDLLSLIASHAVLAQHSPTVLEIPPTFTLRRLVLMHGHSSQRAQAASVPATFPTSVLPQQPAAQFLKRSDLSDALQIAINGGLTTADTAPLSKQIVASYVHKSAVTTSTQSYAPSVSLSLTLDIPTSYTTSTSETKVSPVWATEPISGFGRETGVLSKLNRTLSKPFAAGVQETNEYEDDSDKVLPNQSFLTSVTMAQQTVSSRRTPNSSHTTPSPSSFIIGNLFLSSCPGKKVRLQGPIKGRGGVCRDLDIDLKRIKELGVGCIVCCLDDEELNLLSVSWPCYQKSSQELGIDLLRIPIPEGLAPLSPQSLDPLLSDLIHNYTLKGVPILVHCRGGVGRAGVIACCWLLRLGLCGWVDDTQEQRSISESTPVRTDILELVENVIALLRRRRSMKAVETYEQVRFLVDFVEFMSTSLVVAES